MTQEMRKEDGGLIQKALCDQIFPNHQAAKLEVVSAGSQPAVCRTLPAVMRAAAISSGKALPMGSARLCRECQKYPCLTSHSPVWIREAHVCVYVTFPPLSLMWAPQVTV